jgi:hypothetical protein
LGLRDQLRILRANARIVTICLAVAVALAIVLSLVLPKTWESENKRISKSRCPRMHRAT